MDQQPGTDEEERNQAEEHREQHQPVELGVDTEGLTLMQRFIILHVCLSRERTRFISEEGLFAWRRKILVWPTHKHWS